MLDCWFYPEVLLGSIVLGQLYGPMYMSILHMYYAGAMITSIQGMEHQSCWIVQRLEVTAATSPSRVAKQSLRYASQAGCSPKHLKSFTKAPLESHQDHLRIITNTQPILFSQKALLMHKSSLNCSPSNPRAPMP